MKYLFLLCAFSLFACNGNEVSQKRASLSSEPAPAAAPIAAKDTTKPKQDYIIIENPRQKSEIKQQFPYDIELKTPSGDLVNSEQVFPKNGQPTVLLFWLTTCYPCRLELAAIQKEFDGWQAQTNFNLVAISTDFQKYYPAFVERVEESNWPWKAYNDHKREFRYVMPGGLNGLPQVFVLDAKGEITYHKRRYESGDEHKLFKAIQTAAKS